MSESDAYDRDEEYEATDFEPNPAERGKWVSALVALLGLWLIVEPLLFELTAAQFWNDMIVGIALVILGGYNYYRRADERLGSVSVGAFVALLGLWMIASPFVFGVDGGATEATGAAFWNDIVVGTLVFILGAYSAYEARRTGVSRPAGQTR